MTPRDFLQDVVRPNIAEFEAEYASERRAFNAVAAVDALSAHIYVWCRKNAPDEVTDITDDSAFRAELAKRCPEVGMLRDIAKAQKHVHLNRGNPGVTTAAQITARPTGWGEGRWGEGRWGGPNQVVVTTDSGELRFVEQIVASGLAFLEAELTRLKM
jgi:hypothetical protein